MSDPDILSGLIWVQSVCKGYEQASLVGNELTKVTGSFTHWVLEPNYADRKCMHKQKEIPDFFSSFTKWAAAWDFGSYYFCQNASSKHHTDAFSRARVLIFGLRLHLHPYIAYVSSKGSGKSAHMHRLACPCAQTHLPMCTDSPAHVHRLTCPCAQTHLRMCTDSPARAKTHLRMCTDSPARAQTHLPICTDSPAHVHRLTCACAQTHLPMCTDSPAHVHRLTCACAQTHLPVHRLTCPCAQTHLRMCTDSHARAQTHLPMCTDSPAHVHRLTCPCAQTHLPMCMYTDSPNYF